MPNDKQADVVVEARELFNRYQRGNRSVNETMRAFLLLKALADEVERLQSQLAQGPRSHCHNSEVWYFCKQCEERCEVTNDPQH